MSETSSSTPTAPAEEYVPQNVLSSEDNEDATKPLQQPQDTPQEAAGGADGKPAAETEEERRRSERRREAQRIGYLTKQRYAERARAEAAEQQLREWQARANPGAGQPPPTQQEVERWIDQRAEEKLAAQQRNDRFNEWDAAGVEQFGADRFRGASKIVAEMASDAQRQALVEVVLDTEGGQRAIVELADNPEETERILALPPHRMALAIARLAAPTAAPAPKPVSSLSPPIRPPTAGRARGEADPERGDMSSFERWSAKQQWRR